MEYFDFSKKISALRESLGMTQTEFGKQLGVTNRAVSKWENEISYPSIDSIYKMCKIFNVNIDYFFSDIEENEKNYYTNK